MGDIVAAWTDQGWCDACKTNIEAHPHEPGCPIAEIERLRAALREIANMPDQGPYGCVEDMRDTARKALEGKDE